MRPNVRLRLYHYWRSSSSWRVRLALAHKGIDVEYRAVSLLDGESESPEHRARNPMGFVPVLEFLDETDPGRRYLTESIAIIEWLEERFPQNPLLPQDPVLRARTRALAETINAGTAPLQNLTAQIQHTDDAAKRKAWAQHWIREGLSAYEALARPLAGKFSVGDSLTVADLCLIPQCYNALRNELRLDDFPLVHAIYRNVLETPAAKQSEPDRFKPADFQG